MTVEEMVERYNIQKCGTGFRVCAGRLAEKENALSEIGERKEEIKKYLADKEEQARRAYEERKRKIAAIEGLEEIKNARDDLAKWHMEWNNSFEGEYACGGLGVRPRPQYNLDEMYKKYPIAAAYLAAEKQENRSNYVFSKIGEKAKEAIIENPQNYKEIIDEMEKEIKEYLEKVMWD